MKLPRIEAARGLAACYVVAHHALPHDLSVSGWQIGVLLRFGQEAVILFFLLSGFVIHYSYQLAPVGARGFLFKRATRIFLPLLPALLITYLAQCVIEGRAADPRVSELIGNLMMLQDISAKKPGVIVEPYLGNQPLWSLSYEWWFYLAYILLTRLAVDLRTSTAIAATLSVTCATVYYWLPIWPVRVGAYLSIWWAGVLLADAFLRNGHSGVPASTFVRVLALPLAVACCLLLGAWLSGAMDLAGQLGTYPLLELRHFSGALACIVAAYAWQVLGWRGFNILLAPFATVAPISYGIYIVHFPLLMLVASLTNAEQTSLLAILCAVVLIAASAWVIELRLYPWMKHRLTVLFPLRRSALSGSKIRP